MAEPVKDSAIRTYIKERTNLRVETEAVNLLVTHLTAKTERIVDRAAALVEMEGRSTLQLRDMERAIEQVDSTSSDGKDQTPEKVFQVVEGYTVEQLGELARRIEESLKQ
jgi:histone H3/H4